MRRREFLRLTLGSAGAAVVFVGCERFGMPERELQVQSPLRIPEDTLAGGDAWYGSVCRQCPAGCGIIVRIYEGRAKKVEGNPDYPVNQGKLCARGQASVQELYHPDRLGQPLRRVGDRFTGALRPISWDEALDELVGRLRDLRPRSSLLMATEPLWGHQALAVARFVQAYGGRQMAFAPLEQTVYLEAARRVFGVTILPTYDIANARFLLSFGADFLETWQSPVQYARGYGEFRQGHPASRGYFVQVEPRFSATAANADEWVPIRPGSEGVLALSLAYVLLTEGLGRLDAGQVLTGGRGAAALAAYRPQEAEKITDVPAKRIEELARRLAKERGLVLGGGSAAAHTNGLFNLTAILSLNYLVGNVGERGGVLVNPEPPVKELPAVGRSSPLSAWKRLAEELKGGSGQPVNLLLVQGANPLHGLPQAVGFAEALRRVPYIVSFASVLDDTARLADLVLPIHTSLEDWGMDLPAPGPGYQTVGLQQPVVRPFMETLAQGETRSFVDLLLVLAEELGEPLHSALPWDTTRDLLRSMARALFEQGGGSVRAQDFETFWVKMLAAGGWWDPEKRRPTPSLGAVSIPAQPLLPEFAGAATEYPFHLLPFPSLSLTDGRGAHLPWLQATPDPLTTVAWQTWLEINPQKARELGLREGDLVEVESPQGKLTVPVYLFPAIPKDVVAMPVGQGHSDYGQFAANRGVNPLAILAPSTDKETGALAWAATRVRLRKAGGRKRLPKLEGNVPAVQREDVPIIPVTSGARQG